MYEHSLIVSSTRDISLDHEARFHRVENLRGCFNATKSWFTKFLSLSSFPVSTYPQISLIIFAQLAHCIVALFRLSTFESPDVPWDRQVIIKEFDFGDVMKTLTKRWESVPEAAGLDISLNEEIEESPWIYTRKVLLVIVNWWEVMVLPKLGVATSGSQTPNIEVNTPAGLPRDPNNPLVEPIDFAAVNLDLFDDVWMRDMLEGCQELFRDPVSLA
jgi:hypothetical protein